MKSFITSLVFFLFFYPCLSQKQFHKYYGGDNGENAKSIIQTSDNGFLLVGSTFSFGAGSEDILIVKTDANGIMEWHKIYGATFSDIATSVVQTTDKGYIIGGKTSLTNGPTDHFLMKLDPTGTIEWTKSYFTSPYNDVDDLRSLKQTSDSGFVFTGLSFGNGGNSNKDIVVLKTSSTGVIEWSKIFGTTGQDEGNDIIVTSDGGYLVMGKTKGGGIGSMDIIILKLDNAGNIQWKKSIGSLLTDASYGGVETTGGDFFIIGESGGYTTDGNLDLILTKLSSTGSLIWAKTYGGIKFESEPYIYLESSGNILITANTLSFGPGAGDFLILKTDSSGDTLVTKAFGRTGTDFGRFGKPLSNGNYAFAGSCQNYVPTSNTDFYLFVTNSNFSSYCNEYNTQLEVKTISPTVVTPNFSTSTGMAEGSVTFQTASGIVSDNLCAGGPAEADEFTIVRHVPRVYPNPSGAGFFFEFKNYSPGTKAKIILNDITGKIVYTQSVFSSSSIINSPGLAKGMYFYTFMEEEQIISIGKLIVD